MNGPVTRNADAKLLVCKAEKDLTSSQQRCRWLWKYLPRLSPVAICTILICENCVEKKRTSTANNKYSPSYPADGKHHIVILPQFLKFKTKKEHMKKIIVIVDVVVSAAADVYREWQKEKH